MLIEREEFEEAKRTRRFIVIRDRFNANRVHLAWCDDVTLDHFICKVVTGDGKNGDYHVCDDYEAALAVAQARWPNLAGPCGNCHPEQAWRQGRRGGRS